MSINDESPDAGISLRSIERQIEQVRSQSQSQIFSEVGALQRLLETRLEGIDARLNRAEKFPTDLDRTSSRLEQLFGEKLRAQHDLIDEKIKALRALFEERDKRDRVRDDGNKALLEEQRGSAETAVTKSEAAIRAQLVSTTDLINAVKERVDKTEGQTAGALKLWTTLIVGAGLVVAVVGVVFTRPQTPPEPRIQYLPAPQAESSTNGIR